MSGKTPPEQLQSAPEISPEAQRLEAEEQREIDERIETARIAAEVKPPLQEKQTKSNFPDVPISESDSTPKELREKLRAPIDGAKEKIGISERGESLKTYLAERSKELGEKAKEYGPKTVALIGSLSEKYNKLNWKTKIAATGGLVIGVSLTSAAFPIISAIMTINAEGNIKLDDVVKAPEGARVTPPYPPETIVRPEPVPLLAQETVATSELIKTVDLTEEQAVDETELSTQPPTTVETAPAEPIPQPVEPLPRIYVPDEKPLQHIQAETPATVTNQFGLIVETSESHIYAGAGEGRTFVFGGTPAERANMILEHLTKNPNSVVFGTDDSGTYRIPWYLVEGKITPGVPMRTSGFLGFFSTWMKPPGPEDLQKIIK